MCHELASLAEIRERGALAPVVDEYFFVAVEDLPRCHDLVTRMPVERCERAVEFFVDLRLEVLLQDRESLLAHMVVHAGSLNFARRLRPRLNERDA